jgi:ribonuclease HI
MSNSVLLTIHTDGASRGNPGEAAYAYTIARDGHPAIEEAGRLGRLTNNQAEYEALVRALDHALRMGPEHRLLIHSDSELMVKQMRGEYKVKNEDLRDLYDQARKLVRRFAGTIAFKHVRREHNKRADELCNEALDGLREPSGVFDGVVKQTAAPPVPVPVAPTRSSFRDEVIECLEDADAQPDAESVWRQLLDIFARHGLSGPGVQE